MLCLNSKVQVLFLSQREASKYRGIHFSVLEINDKSTPSMYRVGSIQHPDKSIWTAPDCLRIIKPPKNVAVLEFD